MTGDKKINIEPGFKFSIKTKCTKLFKIVRYRNIIQFNGKTKDWNKNYLIHS